jgi:S1-C subfamily serine protease
MSHGFGCRQRGWSADNRPLSHPPGDRHARVRAGGDGAEACQNDAMSEQQQWAFQDALQPKVDEAQFDLKRAFDAVVLVRAEVPPDAYSAATLGTERGGYGVILREDGLIVTIGYLINEATQIWLTTNRGQVIEGYPLAYDHVTGFGLIQPLGRLNAPHVARGLAADVKVGDSAFVIGHGGPGHSLKTRIVDKREFAGRWEYVLDEALFTAPAHPQWGGAALLDAQGALIGVGSLLMQQEVNGEVVHVNMFVPIDILDPILEPMMQTGRSPLPPRPWLGMTTEDVDGKLIVGRVAAGAPAQRAGVRAGDMVLSVGEQRVNGLAELFRTVWGLGPAGVEVPLTIARGGDVLRMTLKSADRGDFSKKPNLH